MSKETIKQLLKERYDLLQFDEKNARIDLIQQEIIGVFKSNYSEYTFEFIFETLTHFGQAPNLLYDDNGMFAVSSAGYQPVVTGDERIEGAMTYFVEKDQWFPTLREALSYYINN